MATERNNRNMQNIHDECKRLMNYHTVFTMKDGTTFDGIIESVEQDRVIILVGEDVMDQEGENQYNQQRQYGSPRRYRRFRRRAFPLATLIALSLLPYPYYAPPYPYY
ncbi:hypothetical protein, partial [Romboutsia sp. 13368]|uniref:hypothetical protein n=1 Tax=Romboutsia sp. 13368 TaxID=2708053 RepID=UPI0025F22A59